jgi:hypothetical protein
MEFGLYPFRVLVDAACPLSHALRFVHLKELVETLPFLVVYAKAKKFSISLSLLHQHASSLKSSEDI